MLLSDIHFGGEKKNMLNFACKRYCSS